MRAGMMTSANALRTLSAEGVRHARARSPSHLLEAVSGSLDADTTEVAVNCSLATGDRWH